MTNKQAIPSEAVFLAAADLFGLLSNPCRVRIVYELCHSELNVGDLLGRVGGSQPNLSHHLGALYRAGVLGRRRDGARSFYSLVPGKMDLLCGALTGGIGPCGDGLRATRGLAALGMEGDSQ
ncbi:ArsR/SmtB family transcription factor [Paucibacter sp. JuS9]|uniref:ArsR/SmtB family transcription factor n=1 Tax=Paucibacter sp. JuS9 TaxID=3228748 RepID=UPI003757DEDC